jgi:hypothetical protein
MLYSHACKLCVDKLAIVCGGDWLSFVGKSATVVPGLIERTRGCALLVKGQSLLHYGGFLFSLSFKVAPQDIPMVRLSIG